MYSGVFLSLLSLTGLFILLYLIFILYKIIKPIVKIVVITINEFCSFINENAKFVNDDFISFNVDLIEEGFNKKLERNDKNINMIDSTTNDIKTKIILSYISLLEIKKDYNSRHELLREYLSTAIKHDNDDLINKIKDTKKNIDSTYSKIISCEYFYSSSVVADYIIDNSVNLNNYLNKNQIDDLNRKIEIEKGLPPSIYL